MILAPVLMVLTLTAGVLGQNSRSPSEQSTPQPGKPASPGVSAAELEKWIQRLGDADFRAREEAAQKIRQAGVGAIPVLEQALGRYQDPNIQREVKALLASFQALPQLPPTRVHLKLQGATIQETLQALAKQTGYRFEFTPFGDSADGRIVYNWDWQGVTFWQALQELCDRAGITYVEGWYSLDGKTIRLEPGEAHPSYYSLSGPFRVTVMGFSYNRNISFITGPRRWNDASTIQRHESLTLNLRVAVEPRYAFVAVNGVNIEEAEDDKGVSRVLPRQNDESRFVGYYYGGGRMYQQQISTSLLPNDVGGVLKKLRGSISAMVIAGERPLITVENIHTALGKRVEQGEIALQVDEVKDDGQTVQMKVQVWRQGAGQRRDPNWLHTAPQRIKVYDGQGNELRCAGANSWSTTQNTASGTLLFQREQALAGGPAVGIGRVLGGKPKPEERFKVVYCEWELVPAQIPFSFRDVPLP
jgi:hypothetical protein